MQILIKENILLSAKENKNGEKFQIQKEGHHITKKKIFKKRNLLLLQNSKSFATTAKT